MEKRANSVRVADSTTVMNRQCRPTNPFSPEIPRRTGMSGTVRPAARYALTTSCAGVSGRVVCRAAYFVADEGGGIRHGAQAVPPRTHKTCRHCTPKLFSTPRMVIREAMAKGVRPYG